MFSQNFVELYRAPLSDNFNYPAYNCPCALIPGPSAPSFVGDNFYCKSGDTGAYQPAPYFLMMSCGMVQDFSIVTIVPGHHYSRDSISCYTQCPLMT